MSTVLRTAALVLALAAPGVAQERHRSAIRPASETSISVGYGARSGWHAAVRFGEPRRIVCRPALHRVWVPGTWERVWIEPVYSVRRDACGRTYRVLVEVGHWKKVWRPGYWRHAGPGAIRAAR